MKIGKILFVFGAVLLTLTTVLGGRGTAAENKLPPAQEIKEERALSLLKGMSSTLAQAQSLEFKVRGLVPFTAPSGQFISLFAASHVVMQRPDKLFVESRGDLFPNDLYYNGKTMTAIGVQKKFYAQHEASAHSIDAIIGNIYPGGDILELFAEMLVSNPYAALTANVTSAFLVGQSTINGVKANHLAFTGKSLDWEIWIGTEDNLPVLMVVSYREGDRQPTFTVEFTDWKVSAPIPAETFNAVIPADAIKIEFKPLTSSRAQ